MMERLLCNRLISVPHRDNMSCEYCEQFRTVNITDQTSTMVTGTKYFILLAIAAAGCSLILILGLKLTSASSTTTSTTTRTPTTTGGYWDWDGCFLIYFLVMCPEYWSRFEGHCYYLVRDKHSMSACRTDCRQQGADLASIHSSAENQFLVSMIQHRPARVGEKVSIRCVSK